MNSTTVRPAATIEPFWTRLRAITLYPMSLSALTAIGIYAALRWVATFLPTLAGLILTAIALAALYRYASDVLVSTAKGRMKAPEGWASADDGLGWVQIRLQVLLFLLIVACVTIFGPAGLIGVVVIGFAAPGATMSVATDGDLWHALNPATWLAIMGRIGWPYFLVAILCGVITLSQGNAQALLLPFLPESVARFAEFMIAHYATIVTFHLMGYLIYQYHEELGWEIDTEVKLKRADDIDQDVLDAAEAFAAEGKLDAAEAHLREHLNAKGGTPAVHERYRKLLALRGDNAVLLKHGREWLNALLAQNNDRKALDLARECLAIDKSFQPTAAEFTNRLAQRAADLGMTQLALDLLSGFHRAFPKHPDTPKNYLLAAKLMAEKMNAEAKAMALLKQVQQAFPNHPLLPEIESYLKFLEALAAPKRAPANA